MARPASGWPELAHMAKEAITLAVSCERSCDQRDYDALVTLLKGWDSIDLEDVDQAASTLQDAIAEAQGRA